MGLNNKVQGNERSLGKQKLGFRKVLHARCINEVQLYCKKILARSLLTGIQKNNKNFKKLRVQWHALKTNETSSKLILTLRVSRFSC